MKRQGGFARLSGPLDFHDTATGQAADAQRQIKTQGARGRRRLSTAAPLLPKLHDEPLPKARSICVTAASRALSCPLNLSRPVGGAGSPGGAPFGLFMLGAGQSCAPPVLNLPGPGSTPWTR